MKKQLFFINLMSSMIFADGFINPLPASFRSIDNGGTKQAIDAYKDGIGAELMDKPGVATDNTAMNTLVYKYGEAAKSNNVTVVNQVINGNSNPTAADLALAGRLTIDGVSCNDGDIATSGETWLNGICQGGIATNGTSCNDNNFQTVNDKYVNGVCIGTIYSGNLYYSSGTNLFYTDISQLFSVYSSAETYCTNIGMRPPTLNETVVVTPNGIPSTNATHMFWTSTMGTYWHILYNYNFQYNYSSGGTPSGSVRCVKNP